MIHGGILGNLVKSWTSVLQLPWHWESCEISPGPQFLFMENGEGQRGRGHRSSSSGVNSISWLWQLLTLLLVFGVIYLLGGLW